MSDLYVVATLISKADKVDELRQTLQSAVTAFRQEDGCLAYTLLEDQKQAGRFVTYERWRDQAALDAHMQSAIMQKMQPLVPALLGEDMTQDFLSALLVL